LVSQKEEYGAAISFREWALGHWYAPEDCPRQKVWVDVKDGNRPKLRAAFESVPIPPEMRACGPFPGDQIACLYQPSTDEYWEFHGMQQFEVDGPRTGVSGCSTLSEPGWHCNAGAACKSFSINPGWFREEDWPGGGDTSARWGCSGSLLFLWPHVITVAEAQRFYIPHAIRLTIPVRQKTWRWPAQASDGESDDTTQPQPGMIFRFNPTDTLSDVTDPFLKAVCAAIRDFGWILTDGGQTVALKCESQATIRGSQAFTVDAWKGAEDKFGGSGAILSETAAALAKKIPFSRLQVVDASYRPSSIAPGGLGQGV